MIARLLKRLRHRLGWNTGHVASWWDGPIYWIGFRCSCCGEISGAFVVKGQKTSWAWGEFPSWPEGRDSPPMRLLAKKHLVKKWAFANVARRWQDRIALRVGG